eukprot:4877866-Lingulodinium_polyedra.AAC.1
MCANGPKVVRERFHAWPRAYARAVLQVCANGSADMRERPHSCARSGSVSGSSVVRKQQDVLRERLRWRA